MMRLVLFFTYGVSLKIWTETGLIDREILLYTKLVKKGVNVTFITYGDNEDFKYGRKFRNIEIVPFYAYVKEPKSKILKILLTLLLPFVLRKHLKFADILKTNQMWGGWVALISKCLYRKKLIARCGYEQYRFVISKSKSPLYKFIVYVNCLFTYWFADAINVACEEDKRFIMEKFRVSKEKINIFMNYIDVGLFRPLDLDKYNHRILFIGRLDHQKNLFSLLDAVAKTPYELDIIGDGDLKAEIRSYINENNIKANLLGKFPNAKIPEIINRYPLYILPSYYEGNPKALLEAMSCGLAVIGTNVDGTREIIKHAKNGYLCDISVSSIQDAILKVMADEGLRATMGAKARQFIMNNCSLNTIVGKELSLYKDLVP